MSPLAPGDAVRLLEIARASLEHGLARGCALDVVPRGESAALAAPGASFVTLRSADASLRGCVGTLEPTRALAADVAENAYRAGFCDPRFEPLRAAELAGLALSVSLLGAPERLAVRSEAELAGALRPGEDGLILRLGTLRATFLPEVWEALPDPTEFVRALLHKAGLPAFSEQIEAHRYATLSIHGGAEAD